MNGDYGCVFSVRKLAPNVACDNSSEIDTTKIKHVQRNATLIRELASNGACELPSEIAAGSC